MKSGGRFACTTALLFASLHARPALASDVSNELSAGALSSSTSRGSAPFLSDRLGGSVDTSEALSFSGDLTYTRYFHSPGAPGENIFQLAAAGDYTPDDHLSFGADLRGSPTSTDAYLGLTGYRTTQKAHSKQAPSMLIGTPSSLLQYRASVGVTEQLWQD